MTSNLSTNFWKFLSRRAAPGIAAAIGAVIVVLWGLGAARSNDASTARWNSYGLASLSALVIVFVCGGLLARENAKLRQLWIGADGRTSTSKVQYLLWTAGVAFGFLVIAFYSVIKTDASFLCTDKVTEFCVSDEVWEQYVLLLGVPAATAVVAKAIVSAKTTNGTLQKTSQDDSGAKLADLASDDQGRADLIDTQYLIFNLIAFLYFALNFALYGTFVAIPAILLGLTSAAAATYTLNKALVDNHPVIKSVIPSVISPGSTVTVLGTNLSISGDMRMTIGGHVVDLREVRRHGHGGLDELAFDAPLILKAGDAHVVVITGTDQASPYPVTITAAAVMGWIGDPPSPGAAAARVRVRGLPSSGSIEVVSGQEVLRVSTSDRKELQIDIPKTAAPGSKLEITIYVADAAACTGTLQLASS